MTAGDRAWLGLAAYVVGYDLFAIRTGRDTLSQSFARALTDDRRWPTLVAWGYLCAHLIRILPRPLDPMRGYDHVKR